MRYRLALLSAVLTVGALPQFGQIVGVERLAPYVPSPQPIVERMLELAELKPDEVVYDLGCGDGRILITAARDFQAKAVGVELDGRLVKQARDQVNRLGLADRVSVIQGDLMKVDLKPADVVTVYLLTSVNDRLKPAFENSLRKGARVVSHDFRIRGWKPARVETVRASNRDHTIYLYVMPPRKD
jgi:cyclopropane fatty-acyl-phospholipid synthase-like methyltransferase